MPTIDPKLARMAEEIRELRRMVGELYKGIQLPNQALDATSDVTFDSLNVGAASSAASGQVRAEILTPWNSGGAFGGLKSYSGTLADDASVTLTGDNGWFFLREHTGNTIAFIRAGYGAVGVAVSSSITNLVFTDTDTNWCFFHNGSDYVLRNRNGASRSYSLTVLTVS
jgi:hypothetical protein